VFEGKQGQVVLDQIRTVDKGRLVQHLGSVDEMTVEHVLATLGELFAP
jgi:mRNA interferase MazF